MIMRLIIFLSILNVITVSAQDCKYIQNKVSGLDGTRLVITEPLDFSPVKKNEGMKIWSTVYGDTAVVLAFVITSQNSLSVSKGDSLVLTQPDNSKVFLQVLQNAKSTGNEVKILTVLTLLNSENLMKLEQQYVNTISVTTANTKLSYTARKKKQAMAIGQLLGCVKSYLYETQ